MGPLHRIATSSLSRRSSSNPTMTGPMASPGLNDSAVSFLKTLTSLYLLSSGGSLNLSFFFRSILIALTCALCSLFRKTLFLTSLSFRVWLNFFLSSVPFILQNSLVFNCVSSFPFLTPLLILSLSLFFMVFNMISLSLKIISSTSSFSIYSKDSCLIASWFLTKFSTSLVPLFISINSPRNKVLSSITTIFSARSMAACFIEAVEI